MNRPPLPAVLIPADQLLYRALAVAGHGLPRHLSACATFAEVVIDAVVGIDDDDLPSPLIGERGFRVPLFIAADRAHDMLVSVAILPRGFRHEIVRLDFDRFANVREVDDGRPGFHGDTDHRVPVPVTVFALHLAFLPVDRSARTLKHTL
jgi:hypothetical protein